MHSVFPRPIEQTNGTSMSRLKLTEKIISLIDDKIEEIEAYAIDTQENEERYIHDLNCLVVTKYLLMADYE